MKGSEKQMIDNIYNLFTTEDLVLLMFIFINLGLFIDYIDRKISRRKERRKHGQVR